MAKSNRTKISSKRKFRTDIVLYLLFLPALLYIAVIKLAPMPGLLMAFQEFNIFDGFWKSEWVGMKHFITFFTQPRFFNALLNSLEISFLKLFILFPLPIIFAIMLNELKNKHFKKSVQTIIYLPHFLSFVIIHGIFVTFLSTQGGAINNIIASLGMKPINFYTNDTFRFVLLLTEGYKNVGWGTIVYLAALSSVDVQLYEAAQVDGANKWHQMIHITLPSIMPVIALMLTLRLGSILEAGTEQVLVMYNPSVYETADIIGSLVYREGIANTEFSFATAVGLFNSVVSFIFIISANTFSSKVLKRGLW